MTQLHKKFTDSEVKIDIFRLRINRTLDSYRRISMNNLQLRVHKSIPGDTVNLPVHLIGNGLSEYDSGDKLIDVQNVKNEDLKAVDS